MSGEGDALHGERLTWVRRAWERRGAAAQLPRSVGSVILDGELLVYDEQATGAGAYDELGSRPGIQAFGTVFWLRQSKQGAPSRYGRPDARRHLMLKVFDVLYLDGQQVMDRPLSERRALLESGRCFTPLAHYLELSEARRVELGAPDAPLQACFDAARRAGEEGVMVKAAHRPYVPNARTNALKLKAEFIPGLGDTLTLRLYGARAPRTLGRGSVTATHRIAELVVGAAGADGRPQWLCNTSPLPWQDALHQPGLQALWLRLTESARAGGQSLMRRLAVDAPPPTWLRDCPTAQGARPHWVLRDAALAPVVEVVGSRFLRRYGLDSDGASSRAVHWQLRFPRVTRWAEASEGIVPDTVASFCAKAMAAFASRAAEGEGQRLGDQARDAIAAHGRRAAPARWPARASSPGPMPPLQPPQPPPQPTLGWAGELTPSEGSQRRTWEEATRCPQAPPLATAATAAVSLPLPLPLPLRAQQTRLPPHAPPPRAEEDELDTEDEGSEQLEEMRSKWRQQGREEEERRQQRKRSRK